MSGPTRTLAVRLDNAGDVLLSGPAVRALAADGPVTYLCGPAGAAAAALLPGVGEVLTFASPWTGFEPVPTDPAAVEALVGALRRRRIERAAIFTSFHQSPLPAALLLRLAGVSRIAALCEDFPGTLLDHRLARPDGAHEVEAALAVAGALGATLPDGDDGRLRLRDLDRHAEADPGAGTADPGAGTDAAAAAGPTVVLHPGASVPARAIPTERVEPIIDRLVAEGWTVAVTGGAGEPRPRPRPGAVIDLVGRTDLVRLAAVLAEARALVVGNTGPAHLAAAVGTPVVSVFAPVVPWERWRPWGVPSIPLGTQSVPCAGCRARRCPLPGQPCLDEATPAAVAAAVRALAGRPSLFAGAGGGAGAAERGWR